MAKLVHSEIPKFKRLEAKLRRAMNEAKSIRADADKAMAKASPDEVEHLKKVAAQCDNAGARYREAIHVLWEAFGK